MFTVKYGSDGEQYQYTHSIVASLDEAKAQCDRWLAGNGWGGYKPGEMRCWVRDAEGRIVYGTPAKAKATV